MTLSNEEKETIITFDETPADAVIFTYNRKWQTHLEKKLGLKPIMDNGYGGKEYHIPKGRIPLPRVPRKLSPEQREKLVERLRVNRHQKSIIPSESHTAQGVRKDEISGVKNQSRKKRQPQKVM